MLNLPTKKLHNPRVSFTYAKQQQERSHSQQQPQTYQTNPLCDPHHIRCVQTSMKNNYSTGLSLSFQEETIKKEGWDVVARTERKSQGRRVQTQAHQSYNQQQNLKKEYQNMNEISLLKEEIRYMRKKMIESENNEKDLRLEFELYKANIESKSKPFPLQNQDHLAQEMALKKDEIQKANHHLQQVLLEMETVNELYKKKNERVMELQITLNQAINEKEAIKKQNHQKQFQIENILKQNERLNHLFEREKQTRLSIQTQLKELQILYQNERNQVTSISQQLQIKNKDIYFLNNQSYNLDIFLQNALQEIQKLKQTEDKQAKEENKMLKNQLQQYYQKVLALEAYTEHLGSTIQEQYNKYEAELYNLRKEADLVTNIRSKCEKLQNENSLKMKEYCELENNYLNKINYLENEISQLKRQRQFNYETIEKMKNNEQFMLEQLNFLRQDSVNKDQLRERFRQREELLLNELKSLRQNEEENKLGMDCKKTLQEKLLQLSLKFNNKADQHEQHLNKVLNQMQPSTQSDSLNLQVYSSEEFFPSPLQSQQTIQAHSLSHEQVSRYIQQIKNQPEDNKRSRVNQQYSEVLEEMEFMKKAYQQTISDTQQKYEKKIKQNERQYERHLNLYTQQIEQLMQEIAQIKGQYSDNNNNQVEIIHEESEEEDDCQEEQYSKHSNQNIQRDLMMNADDFSDVYCNPSKQDTPVKELSCMSNPPQQKSEYKYMLEDIMDLESKVHNYIKNFNKKRSSTQEQQKQ